MLYPLLFETNLYELVWGGHRLKPLKGLPADDQKIGESWEVSAVEDRESVVSNGELKGSKLTELVRQFGSELLGKAVARNYDGKFPLLIKFIDAQENLSIQVHPDDALAQQRHQSLGKTEMWYVMDAQPGAYLYSGFNQPISKYEYHKRIEDGSICEVLKKHEVHDGDVFFIPAGRVHAICAGILLAEVQESSNITYRIFDYNRLGLDGKPRQLHTQLAEDAIDFTVYDNYLTPYQKRENKPVALAECSFFTTKIHHLTRTFHRKLYKYDSFVVYMCLEGDCQIECNALRGFSIMLHKGLSCLVPACVADINLVPNNADGKTKILEVYIDNKNF